MVIDHRGKIVRRQAAGTHDHKIAKIVRRKRQFAAYQIHETHGAVGYAETDSRLDAGFALLLPLRGRELAALAAVVRLLALLQGALALGFELRFGAKTRVGV